MGFPFSVQSCSGPFRPKSAGKQPFSSFEDQKGQMKPKITVKEYHVAAKSISKDFFSGSKQIQH